MLQAGCLCCCWLQVGCVNCWFWGPTNVKHHPFGTPHLRRSISMPLGVLFGATRRNTSCARWLSSEHALLVHSHSTAQHSATQRRPEHCYSQALWDQSSSLSPPRSWRAAMTASASCRPPSSLASTPLCPPAARRSPVATAGSTATTTDARTHSHTRARAPPSRLRDPHAKPTPHTKKATTAQETHAVTYRRTKQHDKRHVRSWHGAQEQPAISTHE